ncbi:MAG: hypothetical protein OHK0039_37220 [Bacteroidia bacterium]
MKQLLLICLFACAAASASAQAGDTLFYIEAVPGQAVSIKGDLARGRAMPTLAWAWNSAVACFPETQATKFNGSHVLYAIDLPSYSEMEITVVPDKQQTNLSVYAYMVGSLTASNTVPNLSQCVRCEVAHHSEYRRAGQTPGDPKRVVRDILALQRPYQVLIGVAGADGLAQGGYTLTVKINKRG